MSESVSLTVTGMKCGGCESNLTGKLLALPGIITVNVSHQDKQVDLEYEPEEIGLDEIEDAIADAGFSVE